MVIGCERSPAPEPLLNDPLTIKCSKLYAVTVAKGGGVQAAFDCALKEMPMNSMDSDWRSLLPSALSAEPRSPGTG